MAILSEPTSFASLCRGWLDPVELLDVFSGTRVF